MIRYGEWYSCHLFSWSDLSYWVRVLGVRLNRGRTIILVRASLSLQCTSMPNARRESLRCNPTQDSSFHFRRGLILELAFLTRIWRSTNSAIRAGWFYPGRWSKRRFLINWSSECPIKTPHRIRLPALPLILFDSVSLWKKISNRGDIKIVVDCDYDCCWLQPMVGQTPHAKIGSAVWHFFWGPTVICRWSLTSDVSHSNCLMRTRCFFRRRPWCIHWTYQCMWLCGQGVFIMLVNVVIWTRCSIIMLVNVEEVSPLCL